MTVRRGRRDQQQVRLVREPDVRRFPAFLLVVQIGDDRIARERLERQRRDEPLRVGGHHHMHAATLFGQQARQIRRLVRGNGAGHAEDDVLAFAHPHLSLILNRNLHPASSRSIERITSKITIKIA